MKITFRCHPILALTALLCSIGSLWADTIDPSDFEVPEGFEVTSWATTPQLYNPTNFDVDAKGRLWVTEAVNYRNFRNADLGLTEDSGDRVVVLEDSNGDGKADKTHTFVRDKDLVAPLGIGVIGNQVIVSCSPSIIIYTDVDGDLKFDPKVDKKEVFLTGFNGLDHDHSLHGIKVGPDGYWYFNVGNAGDHTVTDKSGWTLRAGSSYAGGSPHVKQNQPGRKSDDGRVWVGGVGLRIKPDGTGLEPICHNLRNVYEEAVSSFGDVFHADNDDPPACRTSWAMEYGNFGFSSADGKRKWQDDQRPGQSVATAEWRQEDPGTIPAGDVYGTGAPTGVAFGENGAFESRYPSGLLLVGESARGEVFSYEPKPQGAGFALQRSVFMAVKKQSKKFGWFRPSDISVGPDGAIYVSDWYDPGVGGHRMMDKSGSGTIYRIAPKGFKSVVPEIDLSSPKGQAEALLNPAVNVRALGWNALRKKGEAGLPALQTVLENPNPLLAVRAVWLLPYAGASGMEALTKILKHKDPQFRIAALRALRQASSDAAVGEVSSQQFQLAQQQLATDDSPAVRRAVSISLRDSEWEYAKPLIQSLAKGFQGWDRWYLEALAMACEGHEEEAYQMLVVDNESNPNAWTRAVSELAWRLKPVAAVDDFKARILDDSLPPTERVKMVTALAFIPDRSAAEAMLEISEGPAEVREIARWWGKNRHNNDWSEFELGKKFAEPTPIARPSQYQNPRTDFMLPGESVASAEGEAEIKVEIVGANRLYLVANKIEEAVDKQKRKKGRREYLPVSVRWMQPTVTTVDKTLDLSKTKWLMAYGKGLPFKEPGKKKPKYKWTRHTLLADPVVNDDVIDTATESVIAFDLSQVKAQEFSVRTSISSEDQATVRFSVYVDHSPVGDAIMSKDIVAKHAGSATMGRALFFSKHLNCVNCHGVSGFGGGIGPDLTQIAMKHSPTVLAEGILEPDAAISMGYESMTVLTEDGLVHVGLAVSAGDPIVLKDAEGNGITIPRDEVEATRASKKSMMPDLKKFLTASEVASLIKFLDKMEME